MTLRRRTQWLLLLLLVPALGTLAAFASVLIGRLGRAAVLVDPELSGQLAAQLRAAEIALWLGCGAVLALALALGAAALQLWLVRPIETLHRDIAQDPALEPQTQTSGEIARIAAALAWYRRQLAKDQVDLASQLGAAGALRDAADIVQEQLAQSDRLALVGRLALGVAHEVGGPLAIAAAQLERLQGLETRGADLQQRLSTIAQAEATLERIHTILADLSQPGLPRTRDADRPCDLLAVALRVQGQAQAHPRCRAVEIELTAAGQRQPADASASHIEQIALNLVLNAADAMKQSGHIHLQVLQDGAYAVLRVDDSGPGVPETERERIFEPFYTTKGHAGWGLGLAVSRRIAQSYAGELLVSNGDLGGARFELRLPVGRQAAALDRIREPA